MLTLQERLEGYCKRANIQINLNSYSPIQGCNFLHIYDLHRNHTTNGGKLEFPQLIMLSENFHHSPEQCWFVLLPVISTREVSTQTGYTDYHQQQDSNNENVCFFGCFHQTQGKERHNLKNSMIWVQLFHPGVRIICLTTNPSIRYVEPLAKAPGM